MHISPRWAMLGAALAALFSPLLVQPAQAAAPVYVALGDSYSSGTGTRSYIDDGTECMRSTQAYPSLIAAGRGYELNLRACSGATIPDVTGTQLSALSAATSYVTISVGGNDAGFADVLTECALPGWASDCDGAIDGAQAFVDGALPPQLASLYADIRGRAPSAQVTVVGYPRIFMGEDCNALTWFSPEEEARLNAMADLINTRTASAASAAGFQFANPTNAFIGHAVCDDPEWLNGLSNPISESYHPNALGHANGYTPVVSAVTGLALTVTRELEATSDATAADQAALQRQYAAADRTIEPDEFVAPDLTTPAIRKAARQAGVDLDRFIARSERAAR
ncbi:SGNH/GDSL hydrolase family protein [Nocardioides oleivorans]|uniref:SGNH/GDSL hydrolase family protein n=1 Tax=Nocardioides oleivorans TaxID=273676 RepID=A0A4Q2RXW2_9ACTN|nr:SGNH/GDSL hydrolase family protein [Nocardioides oleivorans]RYB94110.1 SGNH/GDSL hydrolase family protein [Nocardioides oleivorans]